MATSILDKEKKGVRGRANRAGHPGDRLKARLLGTPTRLAPEVSAIRSRIGFSQPEFGRLTSYSTRVVAGWESGKPLDSKARRKVTEADRLLRALADLMPEREVGDWLRQENDAFDGRAPLYLIEHGELDRLWQMIYQIDAHVAN